MVAAGMEVIELDNEYTRYDLPNDIYNKVQLANMDASSITTMVQKFFGYPSHHAEPMRNTFLRTRTLQNELNTFVQFATQHIRKKLL